VTVAAFDEFKYLCQTTHTTVLVWEHGAAGEREPHVLVVEREHLEKRARLLECFEIGARPQVYATVGSPSRRVAATPENVEYRSISVSKDAEERRARIRSALRRVWFELRGQIIKWHGVLL
jgi:hypothetical protein